MYAGEVGEEKVGQDALEYEPPYGGVELALPTGERYFYNANYSHIM